MPRLFLAALIVQVATTGGKRKVPFASIEISKITAKGLEFLILSKGFSDASLPAFGPHAALHIPANTFDSLKFLDISELCQIPVNRDSLLFVSR